ncbi:oligosaccharide flippase family protein [Brenneria goodwinii]|uniref:oligosaccharide flippase family protein n=1 Tax=Brenneria goodwinii TaxID=1109412 RepID=UPI0036E3136D
MDKKVLLNSIWMMSEKIISIFGVIFVASYVAKYVGPNIFGQIAFATSLFQIAQVIAQLGSDVIIFKRVSKNNESGIRLINTTLSLRAMTYILISIPIVFIAHKSGDITGLIFIIACCISCFFTALDVFSIYYDAKLESKKNVIVNVIGIFISLMLRWGIALLELDPVFLAIPIILTGLIPFCIRAYVFRNNFKLKPSNMKHRKKYTKYLVVAGLTFVVSTLSIAIYTRISMLALGYIDGNYAVGVFSVAVTLASSWSFICNAFITSTLPSIFSEKNDDIASIKTAKLNIFIIIIGMPIILAIAFIGHYFILFLYGEQYVDAYIPLIILSISTMVGLLGMVSARFIARYSGYAFLSKKMLGVAIVSFILSIPLIYWYGINGAAWATLLTEILSLTIFNYLFKGGVVLRMHLLTVSLKKVFLR